MFFVPSAQRAGLVDDPVEGCAVQKKAFKGELSRGFGH